MNFADNLVFIETLLSKKMQESEPALDIFGSDQKVVQIAFQDFVNYAKFNWKIGEKSNNCTVVDKIERLYEADPVEFESFLTVWVGLWFKKWRSRVKLLFGTQSQGNLNKVSETLTRAEHLWGKLECRQELVALMVSALIKNAEICGTTIVAEHLLKMELGKQENQGIIDRKQVFAVLTSALCKARELAQGVGPLLFVKVDNNYFGAVKN